MAGMCPAAPSTPAMGRRRAGGVPGSCPQMSTENCGDVPWPARWVPLVLGDSDLSRKHTAALKVKETVLSR